MSSRHVNKVLGQKIFPSYGRCQGCGQQNLPSRGRCLGWGLQNLLSRGRGHGRGLAAVALVAALTLLACRSSRAVSTPPVLERTQVWQLVEVQGRPVDRGAAPVTLVFNSETSTLGGQTACNTYSAPFTLAPLAVEGEKGADWCSITVGAIEHSSVQCPDAVMNAEARYLNRLRQCSQLALADAGTTLILAHRDRPQLVFELK